MLQVPTKCAETGKAFWQSVPLPQIALPGESEISQGEKKLQGACKARLQKYNVLVTSLLDAIEEGSL
jgi:hypothetical protein